MTERTSPASAQSKAHGARIAYKENYPAQTIVTLDGKTMLNRIIRAEFANITLQAADDGHLINADVIKSTDHHDWCPLFSQLEACLTSRGTAGDSAESPSERFRSWFLYLDFSALDHQMGSGQRFFGTPHGKAFEHLVEHGFTIEDAQGRSWHYSVFDLSASNARSSIISFLADRGFDAQGAEVRLRPELERRLSLDMDLPQLSAKRPGCILWNKHAAYRGLYLTTAYPVPPSDGFTLTKESVLVLEMPAAQINCSVLRAQGTPSPDGTIQPEFRTVSAEEGGSVTLNLFDGEGLITPDWARHIRATIFNAREGDAQPTSFQIRLPFGKGVVHEVDLHAFLQEALGVDAEDYRSLTIEDAFGVPRRLSQVKMVLTTDMLKCHAWLRAWLEELPAERQQEHLTNGMLDPMSLYFSAFDAYQHSLSVLYKRHRENPTGKIESNSQVLSTLALDSRAFDAFAEAEFQHAAQPLHSAEEARAALLGPQTGEDRPAHQDSAIAFALEQDVRFVFDPHIWRRICRDVNGRLIDLATGNVPITGTQRLLSQDLLAFLCHLAEGAVEQNRPALSATGNADAALDRISRIQAECLPPQTLHLPHYAGPSNGTGWLAMLRNPHLSRSEQCALRPLHPEEDSWRARYLDHLEGVAMVSCTSPEPMVLGGADYDGDRVQIYDDATVVEAVLRGAYLPPDEGTEAGDALLTRRFPVADLGGVVTEGASDTSGTAGGPQAETLGERLTSRQLVSIFQNATGILSNSAFILGSVLYGEREGVPPESAAESQLQEDPCARYTIAVGMDIDAVKTGMRLDANGFRFNRGAGQDIAQFGVEGKMLPREMGFIYFKDKIVPDLKGSAPLWEWKNKRLKRTQPGELEVQLKGWKDESSFKTLDLDAALDQNSNLKGASVSNVQRLPWLMMKQAQEIHDMAAAKDSFMHRASKGESTPLQERADAFAETVDSQKLEALEALINAHHDVMRALDVHKQQKARAQSSRAFGKARICAQEYPTLFSEEEVEDILWQAMQDIQEHFAAPGNDGYEEVLDAFKRRGFPDWALCPADERASQLEELLPGLAFRPDFYLLLEDDGLVNGFMIPFHLIQEAQAAQKEAALLEASERDPEAGSAPWDERMHAELTAIANRHLAAKSPSGVRDRDLLQALKARIEDVLAEKDHLAAYLTVLACEGRCFSQKRYGTRALFWDLLSPDDIAEVMADDGVAKENEGSSHVG